MRVTNMKEVVQSKSLCGKSTSDVLGGGFEFAILFTGRIAQLDLTQYKKLINNT